MQQTSSGFDKDVANHLRQQYDKAQRRLRWRAFLLVSPLLSFIVIAFIVPIGLILVNSFYDDTLSEHMPKTANVIEQWQDTTQTPPEAVYEALVLDLVASKAVKDDGKIATRLNYEQAGLRTLIKKTSRRAKNLEAPFKEAVIKIDKRWGDPHVWRIIGREISPFTISYYVAALDKEYDKEGDIVAREEHRAIYVSLFVRTLVVGVLITLFCVVLGFPVAYLLSTLPDKIANLMMIMVLLPFWTSLLVRTTSWIVLLQTHGPLNDLLVLLGIVGDTERVRMIYNMAGTLVAMTHILLPFMILPVYSVMKNIPPTYMRAAISLGANWWLAFRRVYIPLTVPGIGAGGLLVFILAIGYYITPALVGGSTGQLISNLIAYHMQNSLNWGLAAALSGMLLAIVLILYWLYNKLFGLDRIRF